MNSNRQDTRDLHPFLKQDERTKCCEEDKTPDCDEQSKECFEEWKEKLSEAYDKMMVAQACYDKAKKTHTQAESWKNTLKTWKKNAEDVHEKAQAVQQELCQFLEAVGRTKTIKTVETAKAVLCLVKSIFDDIDDLLYISKSEEASANKAQLQQLKKRIECYDCLDAAKKEKALTCISAFEDEMKLVQAEKEKLLNNLLEILHHANGLVEALDKSDAYEDAGIHEQLEDLHNRISGKESDSNVQQKQVCAQSLAAPDADCDSDIIVTIPEPSPPPQNLLPIQGENNGHSPYYMDIEQLYNAAKNAAGDAKKLMADRQQAYYKTKSYHDGLSDAIKASEAVKPAK